MNKQPQKPFHDTKPPAKFVAKNPIAHEETAKVLPAGSILLVAQEEMGNEFFTGTDEMGKQYKLHSSMGCFYLHYP